MSNSDADAALRRLGEVGARFRVMNALFHVGPVLLLPGIVGLGLVLGPISPGPLLLGSVFAVLGFAIPIGWIFSLNEGLARLVRSYATASVEERAAMTSAADLNLGTQAGGELVQSALSGLWAVIVSLVMLAADWPAWVAYLGVLAGFGMILAGMASVLGRLPILGKALGLIGGVGVFSFGAWIAVVGIRLMTVRLPV